MYVCMYVCLSAVHFDVCVYVISISLTRCLWLCMQGRMDAGIQQTHVLCEHVYVSFLNKNQCGKPFRPSLQLYQYHKLPKPETLNPKP